MNNKSSRWRKQKNGVPQGSILAPTLFNVYTYDLPELKPVKHFLFADDFAILAQDDTFRKVEAKLEIVLKSTGNYYQEWGLSANPGKTKVCAYHLNNKQAKRQLSVHWLGKPLEHKEDPEYLGITLDRSLTYKHHIVKLKKKLQTRVNLLKQLGNSSWGSNASTTRTAALSLVFATGEFCAPVWSNSSNASKIDPVLNETCRVITGCLKRLLKTYTFFLEFHHQISKEVLTLRLNCTNSPRKETLYSSTNLRNPESSEKRGSHIVYLRLRIQSLYAC